MPGFVKGGTTNADPFGKNEFLRSTQDVKYESYTVAKSTIPAQTINGDAGQKILQPGTVMAKITSGADVGKIGPYQAGSGAEGTAGVNEVQTLTVTATGGTFTLSFGGDTTAAIAEAATAAAVEAALESLTSIDPGDVAVTGSAGGPFTITFGGQYAETDVPLITADATALTPGGSTAAVVQTTPGSPDGAPVGGASDGRGNPANIVGINSTFLPWQLIERDVEVAVAYEASVRQSWCIELDADGTELPLSNATALAMASVKGLNINFRP